LLELGSNQNLAETPKARLVIGLIAFCIEISTFDGNLHMEHPRLARKLLKDYEELIKKLPSGPDIYKRLVEKFDKNKIKTRWF
ncbi:MAG: hypothetical protein ACK4M7_07900, partial [Burkholderiales bacterium]